MPQKLYFTIHGGLGNQLFQYAAGLDAERRWGVPVEFDVLASGNDRSPHPRPFMLDRFMVTRPIHYGGVLWRKAIYGTRCKPISTTLHRCAGVRLTDEQVSYEFDSQLINPAKARCLIFRGYWQGKMYVDGVKDLLRSEFRFREQACGQNKDYLEHINNCEHAVSLHIRRGDYHQVANGSILLPIAYYQSAILKIEKVVPNPIFFVFSDDLGWVKKNMPSNKNAIYVEGNPESLAHEDLRLMSACRHHIIANSSFSWWGAWLNHDPNKIVILPKYWMGSTVTNPGMIPEGWETVWAE